MGEHQFWTKFNFHLILHLGGFCSNRPRPPEKSPIPRGGPSYTHVATPSPMCSPEPGSRGRLWQQDLNTHTNNTQPNTHLPRHLIHIHSNLHTQTMKYMYSPTYCWPQGISPSFGGRRRALLNADGTVLTGAPVSEWHFLCTLYEKG